jgi:hypothetical protein
VSARRLLGFVAAAAVYLPLLLLMLWGAPRLPLPFFVVLVVGVAGILGALKLAYELRARVDPSFDPSFGAYRPFDRWPLRPRS